MSGGGRIFVVDCLGGFFGGFSEGFLRCWRLEHLKKTVGGEGGCWGVVCVLGNNRFV